jgi:hypothetical protein
MTKATASEHVVVVGRSPEKMRQALHVLESAGFTATGTFNRDEAMAAIEALDKLFAVVAGGSVDREAEAELRAAAALRGGHLVRVNIGDSNPTQHFIDEVLPQLEHLRSARHGVSASATRSTTFPRLPGVATRSNASTASASGKTESTRGRNTPSSTRRPSCTSSSPSASTTK